MDVLSQYKGRAEYLISEADKIVKGRNLPLDRRNALKNLTEAGLGAAAIPLASQVNVVELDSAHDVVRKIRNRRTLVISPTHDRYTDLNALREMIR
jgi:hypothetical protein